MRHLPLKDYTKVPEKLLKASCLRKINRAVINNNGKIFDGYYYKDKTVKDKLAAFSLHKQTLDKNDSPKCYYCESKIEHAATLQVEHYRPKAKVDERDTNGSKHEGYFWLGCEWSNLLLSCPVCNGKKAKGNRFPIKKNRAIAHNPVNSQNILNRVNCYANKPPLTSEEPLLLNPEIDKPENCIIFNSDAKMIGTNEKAKETIKILNLNREPLLKNRQRVFDEIFSDIDTLFIGYKQNKVDNDSLIYILGHKCKMIIEKQELNQEYSLWAKCFNDNFETIITERYNISEQRKILLEIFIHHQTNKN